MEKKITTIAVLTLTLLILSLTLSSAIVAKIGNSRMVLRDVEPGETITKHIRVINDNSEPVTITFIKSGDLKDEIILQEEEFVLQPEQEKNARFTIKSNNEGTFESKINVLFTPNEGNAAGLASTIIMIVGNGENSEETENTDPEETDQEFEELSDDTEDSGFSFNPSAKNIQEKEQQDKETKTMFFLIGSTALLALILAGLFIFTLKKSPTKNKKSSTKKVE